MDQTSIKPQLKELLIKLLKDKLFLLIKPAATRVEQTQEFIKLAPDLDLEFTRVEVDQEFIKLVLDLDQDQEFTRVEVDQVFTNREPLVLQDRTSKDLTRHLPTSHTKEIIPIKVLPTRVEQVQEATPGKVELPATLVNLAPASIAPALRIATKRNDAIH